MQRFFICKGCGRQKPINPKLKGTQEFCGDHACQKARKAAWQMKKMTSDPDYYSAQKECMENWRKSRPLDKYQSLYRRRHPEYVQRNRESQKIRNQKREQDRIPELIVKMDALTNANSSVYLLTFLEKDIVKKIVKMDAFMSELSIYQCLKRYS
jgi:hypothetical protein